MIGDRDADPIGGRREVVAGVEHPVAALLLRDERAFDQMAFPIEVVGEDDMLLADQRARRPREPPRVDRRPHRLEDIAGACRIRSAPASPAPNCRAPPRSAAASGRSAPSTGACSPRAEIAAAKAAVRRSRSLSNSSSINSGCSRSSPASGRGQRPFVSFFQKRKGVPSSSTKMWLSITPPLAGPSASSSFAAGDHRRAIVGPRAVRASAPGKADRQRVDCSPGRIGEPIFVADPGHFRRPEIGGVPCPSRPSRAPAPPER